VADEVNQAATNPTREYATARARAVYPFGSGPPAPPKRMLSVAAARRTQHRHQYGPAEAGVHIDVAEAISSTGRLRFFYKYDSLPNVIIKNNSL
jgi:hypothetical protein